MTADDGETQPAARESGDSALAAMLLPFVTARGDGSAARRFWLDEYRLNSLISRARSPDAQQWEQYAMNTFESVAVLATKVGEVLGTSDWVTITQDKINMFADATGDHQWIHVDPEKAASSPLGTTIAHGLMTLGMVPHLAQQFFHVKDTKMVLNYGLNKVRYPAPVPAGSRVRAQVALVSVEPVGSGGAWQVTISANIEIDGGAKPAAVGEIVLRIIS